jgi:hypothetical protein
MIDLARRIAFGLIWLVAAALLSFGAAGIVAGIDHPPGPARPELTYQADTAVAPVLDGGVDRLREIGAGVEALGLLGRRTLSAMIAGDDALLDSLLAEGGVLASALEDRAAGLRVDMASLPGTGAGGELVLGADLRARHARLLEAATTTAQLEESWTILTSGSLASTRMTAFLTAHDAAAFAATEAGRGQDYEAALARLAEAEGHLADASALRDRLAGTIDTSTLDEWLRRNVNYDAALRRLYTAFRDSGGRVTQEVRDAIAGELAARELLPEDTNGLLVIVAEIGRGGANQAVIEIEETRAILDAALAVLEGPGR